MGISQFTDDVYILLIYTFKYFIYTFEYLHYTSISLRSVIVHPCQQAIDVDAGKYDFSNSFVWPGFRDSICTQVGSRSKREPHAPSG